MGHIFEHNTGKALNSSNQTGELKTYITTSNLYWNYFNLSSLRQMYFSDSEIGKCTVIKGDLLVCEGGDIGRAAIWNYEYDICIQNHIHRLRAYIAVETMYYYYIFLLYKGLGYIGGKGIGIQGLSSGALHNILVPVPSVSEQCRITTYFRKIEPIIDKYNVAQTALNSLNTDIYENLRKSILQEAIQGKLVPQDPNDEPASILLQRIHDEKLRLVKEGKLKKKDISDSIIFRGDDNKYYEQVGSDIIEITDNLPFEIPNSWEWCRLRDICSIFTGATFKKEDVNTGKNEIRILRGGNILPYEIVKKTDDIFLAKENVKETILLKQNDIITPAVTSLENIGKMARVEQDMTDTTIGGFVFVLRPHYRSTQLSKFLLYFMSSPSAIEYMKSITNKSGQAFYNIGKERLAMTLLPIPPFLGQKRIVDILESIFDRIKDC